MTPADRNAAPSVISRQVRALTWANLKSRYRKTYVGFLWVVLNPLIQYGVQAIIFSQVLNINVVDYPVFLLSGLLPWILITSTLEMSVSSFVNSADFLKAYQVHPLVMLLSQVLDNLVNFIAAFAIILIGVMTFTDRPMPGLWLAPLALAPLTLGAASFAYLLATAQVFSRDVRFVLSFFLNVTYFATPIFYPIRLMPERLRWVAEFNPLYRLIDPFRVAVYEFEPVRFAQSMIVAIFVAFVFFLMAWTYWKRKRNEVYFVV